MIFDQFIRRTFPESGAGGFSWQDGTIQFYLRVNALLQPHFRVLDLGAGRGGWAEGDTSTFKVRLRALKGKVKEVVGQDVDPVVLTNSSLDDAVVSAVGERLPFSDAHFDMIVADYVFEHVADGPLLAAEISRVLKPNGWLCARTPNRWAYVSLLTRLIKNRFHSRVLHRAQPWRKDIDVFPTAFRMNSMSTLRELFSPDKFVHHSYYYQAEPSYHFNSVLIFSVMRFIDWLLPRFLSANIFVFLQRR